MASATGNTTVSFCARNNIPKCIMDCVAGDVSSVEKDARQQRLEMLGSEDEFILQLQLNKKKGQGHALGPGNVSKPSVRSIGKHLPKTQMTQNPYDDDFWFSSYVWTTPSLRIRRSVFEIPNTDRLRHYVHMISTSGGVAQFEKIKMTSDDLAGVIEALTEIKKEIDAYPSLAIVADATAAGQ